MSKFGLALSGGGFRATLFHLGAVRYLRDAGLLHQVTHVVSVSGGSILAAHLVLNWKRYNGSNEEFEAAAKDIIDFVQLDIRNRIVRRLPLMVPLRMFQRISGRAESRTFISTGALERLYDRFLYRDQSLRHLPSSPELHILTTNVSEGKLCSFTQAGLILQGRASQVNVLPAQLASISMAVAASSAFPGFFPPVVIAADDLGLDEGTFPTQSFTDGGVYDNLGVRAFDLLNLLGTRLDRILVSDAGKPFRVISKRPLGLLGRNLRASDILWDRVWQLEKQNFDKDERFSFFRITDCVERDEDPTCPDRLIQTEIKQIRTDLDRFSPLEIRALVQHGYCIARKMTRDLSSLPGNASVDGPPWNPFQIGSPSTGSKATVAEQPQLESVDRAVGDARQLRRSSSRRIWQSLLDFRDWPTYLYIPLLIGLFVVLPAYLWDFYRQARIDGLVVHAIAHGQPDYRKILDLVKNESIPKQTPLPIESLSEPSKSDYSGFELISDTIVVDLRNQVPNKESYGYYYRRIRLRRLAEVTAFILQQDTPYDQVNFHNVSESAKLKVSKVVGNSKPDMTKWEVEFDLSRVPVDGVVDLDFEAYFFTPIAANKLRQTWLRYLPVAKTSKAAVWLLFPSNQPYEKYSLTKFKSDAPSVKTLVETDFTVDHPFGDIIGWTVLNPEVDHTYVCEWKMKD